jgi:ABC-type multidrug transport system ATPase subunit
MGSIINYTKAVLKQKLAHPVKALILFLLPLFFFFGAVGAGKAIFKGRRETEDKPVSFQHILITVATLTFYLFYTLTAAYDVVRERQMLRKQHMLANGLGNLKYFLGWTLAYTILMLPTMIVMMVVVYFLGLFPHVNIIVQFIDMLIFQMSGITVAFWVSATIPFPLLAFIIVFIFNTGFAGAYFGMAYIPENVKETLCLFVSPMAIGTVINNFQHAEIRGDEITLGNIIPFRGGKYNVWANTFKLILNNVLYLTLGIAQEKIYNHLRKSIADRKMEKKFVAQARDSNTKSALAGPSIFSADKVFKSYFAKKTGAADSLTNVNLEIQKGETFAITGEKGSGKSTLMKLLCSREVPSYGTLYYAAPTGLSQKEIMSTLGSVAPEDDYVLFENASVADNINLYSSFLKNKINGFDLLKELNFTGKKGDRYSKLDAAEKAKVKAAIALMCDKDVFFFDEPTKDMTEKDKQAFWKLVESKKQGKTVVFSTTSFEEAAAHADRTVVLEKGSVASLGKVEINNDKVVISEEQLEVKVEC